MPQLIVRKIKTLLVQETRHIFALHTRAVQRMSARMLGLRVVRKRSRFAPVHKKRHVHLYFKYLAPIINIKVKPAVRRTQTCTIQTGHVLSV